MLLVYFCVQARTSEIKNSKHPEWNEEIVFIVDYPTNHQIFTLQTFKTDTFGQAKCIADFELHFDEMTFKNVQVGQYIIARPGNFYISIMSCPSLSIYIYA